MLLLSPDQLRRWDAYTIRQEPVTEGDLMERAAKACTDWLLQQGWHNLPFQIFCGKGNNGGDGLAIARQLLQAGAHAETWVLETGKRGSAGFEEHLAKLHAATEEIHFLSTDDQFPFIRPNAIVVDALFGTGLNGPITGMASALVSHINESGAIVVSVDLPSGLLADRASTGRAIVRADQTLTFQVPKTGLLVQDNADYSGVVTVLPIGLHPGFLEEEGSSCQTIERSDARVHLRSRSRFAHKGSFGHALLAGGSWGKMGAAILAARSCLRSGVGLLSCFIPACGYSIMQASVPEAMALTDKRERTLSTVPENIEKFDAIGVGPGIGTAAETMAFLHDLLRIYRRPLVVDADALNLLGEAPALLDALPPGSILTPHRREFDRVFGSHDSDFDRIETARHAARDRNIVVLLKGHHTVVATPTQTWFNTTGNAGMAKGGSGDVLTGVLTSLLAQDYPPADAAVLGVYLHGLAGDLCAEAMGMESMLPGDLPLFFGHAFKELKIEI
jgi:hydroxyethylthiazole kinase-like uncharacterized protein yjeF